MSTVDQAVPQDGSAAQMPVTATDGGVGTRALRDAVDAALARLTAPTTHGAAYTAEPEASPSWGGAAWTATAVRANHDSSTAASGGGTSASGAATVAAIVVLLDRVVDAAIVEHAKRWALRVHAELVAQAPSSGIEWRCMHSADAAGNDAFLATSRLPDVLARQRPLILAVDLVAAPDASVPAVCVHIDLPEIAMPTPLPLRRADRDRDRDRDPGLAFHPFSGIDTGRAARRPSLSSSLPGSEDSLPRSRSRSPHSSPNTPHSADSPWRRLEVNEAMPASYSGSGLSPRRLSVPSAAPLQPIVEHDDESVLAASTPRPTHRASPSSGRSSPGSDGPATTPTAAPQSASPPPSPGSLSTSAGRPRRAPLLRQSSLSHVTSAPEPDRPAAAPVAAAALAAAAAVGSGSDPVAAADSGGGDNSPGMTRRRLTVGSTDDVVDSMRAAAVASVSSFRRAVPAANGNSMASDPVNTTN